MTTVRAYTDDSTFDAFHKGPSSIPYGRDQHRSHHDRYRHATGLISPSVSRQLDGLAFRIPVPPGLGDGPGRHS